MDRSQTKLSQKPNPFSQILIAIAMAATTAFVGMYLFTAIPRIFYPYDITGFWYELVRADSLFVALSVAGLAMGSYGLKKRCTLIFAAGLMALAFFTKQTAIIFGVGLAFYLTTTLRRRSL